MAPSQRAATALLPSRISISTSNLALNPPNRSFTNYVGSRPPSRIPTPTLYTSSPSIPRRKDLGNVCSPFLGPGGGQKMTFFGIGEILSVITNPGDTVRSLAESRKLLEEARQEIQENRERAQIPAKHTFSPLPGFFPRKKEMKAIERSLSGVPCFTVIFGQSSVGKTALLRQILSKPIYHVLHFDLRIAGFADLRSLYFSLATQMEGYFTEISEMLEGYKSFEKAAWSFRYDRMDVERRLENGGIVRTSDIARLMELFQSALLKYWEFEPEIEGGEKSKKETEKPAKDKDSEGKSKPKKRTVKHDDAESESGSKDQSDPDVKLSTSPPPYNSASILNQPAGNPSLPRSAEKSAAQDVEDEKEGSPPEKKVPVFFLDESHKLPALIESDTMKCLLDAMLVLTKQDRLCHCIHATSDSFYMHWLRQMNIMQHCKILSIGDCSKSETREYFEKHILEEVEDEKLRDELRYKFEELWVAFGGKLAHWGDFVSDFVNSEGTLRIKDCSHYLQAHALLNLQLVHSSPLSSTDSPDSSSSSDEPSLGSSETSGDAPGFHIYSPLQKNLSPHSVSSPFMPTSNSDSSSSSALFSASDLITVMKRLQDSTPDDPKGIAYFPLCRELGAGAVDGLVKGRILELRWSDTITKEGNDEGGQRDRGDEDKIVGPVLVPTTPIVRYAMEEVLKEWGGWKDASDQEVRSRPRQ